MIPAERPHLIVAALSHPGERREHNEDRFSVTSYRLNEDQDLPVLVAIVADGIGGHQAGEVAADLTVQTIADRLAAVEGEDPLSSLREALMEASQVVMERAKEAPEREGMGSTATVAWILGSQLYVASVGDSRAYLFHRKRLRQVTIDHTWVQEAVEQRILSPAQAEGHPHTHVLRRYVGAPKAQALEPDLRLRLSDRESDERSISNQGLKLERGDRILLCTDGLTDLVQDEEIRATLLKQDPRAAARSLIQLARARGGHDNITAVILAVPGKSKGWSWRGCSGLASAVILSLLGLSLAGALAATWWFGSWPWTLLVPTPTATPGSVMTVAAPTPAPSLPAAPTISPTQTEPTEPTLVPTLKLTSTPIALPTVAPTEG